tara:strand:- start:138 stop:647 length:510 start_codon:yes stop_codon:yes gene_type:complete
MPNKSNCSQKKNQQKCINRSKKLLNLKNKLPKHYYKSLSLKEQDKQIRQIQKSQKLYKQKKYFTRKKMSSFKPKISKHITDFKKCYGISLNNNRLISKKTGVPIKVIEEILRKGRGAYYSAGSRPNQTAESWARARLASALLKRSAYNIDKHIFQKYKVTKIKSCIKSS